MIHLGILGAGMIVHDFLSFAPNLEDYKLEAIAATPRSVDKLKGLCEKYDIPAYCTSEDELISDPNVDTVYVATPNHLHYEGVKKSLEAGKNVICEKPFTSNAKEAEELLKLADEKGLFVLEAVSTRFLPNVLEIKKLLPKLGNIKIVNMNYSQYSSRYDAFKAGQILPAFNPEMSGGALMDINIYNINLAVTLFGKPEQVEYFANVERGIDTSGILVLDYGSFKCVCTGAKDCKAPLLSCIQGDEGCILIPSPANVTGQFEFQTNKSASGNQGAANTGEIFDFNQGKHRMEPEFIEFARILEEKDMDTAKELADITRITMDIQSEARRKAGIVFPADQK